MNRFPLKKIVKKKYRRLVNNCVIITNFSKEEVEHLLSCDFRTLYNLGHDIKNCLNDFEKSYGSIFFLSRLIKFELIVSEEKKEMDELLYNFDEKNRIITLYHPKKDHCNLKWIKNN